MKKVKTSSGMTWHLIGSYIFSEVISIVLLAILSVILIAVLTKIGNNIFEEVITGCGIALGIIEDIPLLRLTSENVLGMYLAYICWYSIISLVLVKFGGWKKFCVVKQDIAKVIRNIWTIILILFIGTFIISYYEIIVFYYMFLDLTVLLAMVGNTVVPLLIFGVVINKFIKPILSESSVDESTIKEDYNCENNADVIQYGGIVNNTSWDIDNVPKYDFGEIVSIEKDDEVTAAYINRTNYNEWIKYINKLNSYGFNHYDILGEGRNADLELDIETNQATEQMSNGRVYVSVSYFQNDLDDGINYNVEIMVWSNKPESWQ